jgi:hypothetical protein
MSRGDRLPGTGTTQENEGVRKRYLEVKMIKEEDEKINIKRVNSDAVTANVGRLTQGSFSQG